MATNSILHNIVIDTDEVLEKFIDALEQAEKWAVNKTNKKKSTRIQCILDKRITCTIPNRNVKCPNKECTECIPF